MNPVLRDVHEYILVFSKGSFKREGRGKESTVRKEDFIEFTRSVWMFPPASAKSTEHPAPFPLELPRRCIELYTFKGDEVLDLFAGSGTTCVTAAMPGRHYVGVEINKKYVDLARKKNSQRSNFPLWF